MTLKAKDRFIPQIGTGAIVSPDGRPLTNFQGWLNRAFTKIQETTVSLGVQLGLIQQAQTTADGAAQTAAGAANDAAQARADAAQATADAAQAATDAASAYAALSKFGDDGVLTPLEKNEAILRHRVIIDQQSDDDAKAIAAGIGAATQKTNYDNAITALSAYLATLTSPVAWDNTSDTTTISRTAWNNAFYNAVTSRVLLLNKIAQLASQTAAWASVTGIGKPDDFADVTAANSAIGDSNRVRFSRFESDTTGWKTIYNPATLNVANGITVIGGLRSFYAIVPFAANNQDYACGTPLVDGFRILVKAGERLSVQAKIAVDAGNAARSWSLYLGYMDITGAQLGVSQLVASGTGNQAIWLQAQAFLTVPTGAYSAWIDFSGHTNATGGSGGNMTLRIAEPMVCSAGTSQTVHPAFTAGAGYEFGSDVTKQIIGPSDKLVTYDYLGTGQGLPTNLVYSLNASTGKITSGISFGYTVISGTVNGFTSASGEQAMSFDSGNAVLSLTALGSLENRIEVRAYTTDAQQWKLPTTLRKDVQPAPAPSTGGGSMPVNFSVSCTITGSTFAEVAAFSGTLPTSKTAVAINTSVYFELQSGGKFASTDIEMKVQRNIAGTWADIGSTASATVAIDNYETVGNTVTVAVSDTGLTGGSSYDWRLVARTTSTSRTASGAGDGSVTAP